MVSGVVAAVRRELEKGGRTSLVVDGRRSGDEILLIVGLRAGDA